MLPLWLLVPTDPWPLPANPTPAPLGYVSLTANPITNKLLLLTWEMVNGTKLVCSDNVITDHDVPKDDFWKNKFMEIQAIFFYYDVHVSRWKQLDNSWLWKSLFRSTYTVNGKICHFIIDSGNCENVVMEDTVRKLSLRAEVHPSPYQLAWLKQGYEIKLLLCSLVPLSICTNYKDDIYCDVVPMDVCAWLIMEIWSECCSLWKKIILIVFKLNFMIQTYVSCLLCT